MTGACLKPAVNILPLYAYSPWAASHRDTFPTEMHAKDFHENVHASITDPKLETTQVHQRSAFLQWHSIHHRKDQTSAAEVTIDESPRHNPEEAATCNKATFYDSIDKKFKTCERTL